ncbi:MAG: peptidase M24 [Bacteroidia bacterium]|nr:MAG: peptidase M24 [Bacteroidia bacterium]PIE86447.1 MAG: peptidase M24 [Bacteroidia bacterium]
MFSEKNNTNVMIQQKERLKAIQSSLRKNKMQALIIPNTDPHNNEYLAENWKFVEWISGFSGSAATLVITPDFAGLWTDARYLLQGKKQLQHSDIELFILKTSYAPEHIEWLTKNLSKNSSIGIDFRLFSLSDIENLREKTILYAFEFVDINLFEFTKKKQENPSITKVFELDTKFTGESRLEKINKIKKLITKKGATDFIITALDEIAWLLNIRGNDIAFNPLFESFLLISQNKTLLYIDQGKLPDSLQKKLEEDKIYTIDYEQFYKDIEQASKQNIVLIDKQTVNFYIYEKLEKKASILKSTSPVLHLKAIKNQTELENIKNAHIADGIAMSKLLHWIEKNYKSGELTEFSIGEKANELRSLQENYISPSFYPIVGFKENAAVVHYAAREESCKTIDSDGILLIDSGGQYLNGTTDITRTVSLGLPTEKQKRDYTLVLKSYINLASLKFPQGTCGYQIDAFARQFLWEHGQDYGHGTSHGVGFFLNVHEGPQRISVHPISIALQAGNVISIEPGFYLEGKHGIRIENLLYITEYLETECGKFYKFENLTLCPLEEKLIEKSLLTSKEKVWINNYHQEVYETLEAFLNQEERLWLREKTKNV